MAPVSGSAATPQVQHHSKLALRNQAPGARTERAMAAISAA
jgi:hypothetical protein